MKPHYDDGQVSILHGDARELDGLSADVVVTDPPYGLAFMGKAWDRVDQGFHQAWATAAFQALPPGGWLLAFGGTRTWHRLACGIEDAGFEIRDTLMWLYGSGFPKSHDVGKAIDKRPGVQLHRQFAVHLAERREQAGLSRADVSERVVGTRTGACWNWEHHQFPEARWWPALRDLLGLDERWGEVIAEAEREVTGHSQHHSEGRRSAIWGASEQGRIATAPATPEAERWQGWGTALKPAWEPIVVARKPLAGTVAQNVLEHGVGALNIDACRIGMAEDERERLTAWHARYGGREYAESGVASGKGLGTIQPPHPSGRWPPNVVLTHGEGCQPVGVRKVRPNGGPLDRSTIQAENKLYGAAPKERTGTYDRVETVQAWECEPDCPVFLLDQQSGETRAEKADRRLPGRTTLGVMNDDGWQPSGSSTRGYADKGGASRFYYTAKAGRSERIKVDGEQHPTVKPLALMRWLVRLVTPPGGTVLDPFCGSGSTLVAARMEGFRAIGIEADERWCEGSAMRLREHEQGQGVLDLSG